MAGYNLGTATGRIEIDGSGVEKGFAVAKTAVGAFADSINNQRAELEQYGRDMTRNAVVGATGFAVATKAAMDFEKQLSGIQAVSGATSEDMARVSAAALEIGSSTKYSATEAALAFEELIKAGIPLEEALNGAARSTVDLAAAGEIALPRAAEIAANAMNNFNKSGSDMPQIADTIAGAANASAISVEEFAQSMSQVGAVANLAGVSFEDTAVAIAEMGNAGIKGSDAGTSLKTMLMNLQPVTTAQQEEFEKLGLTVYDAEKSMDQFAKFGIQPTGDSLNDARAAISQYLVETQGLKKGSAELTKETEKFLVANGFVKNAFFDNQGNAKGLAEMQGVLAEATKDMTNEQKLASLEVLFGADAVRAAAIMAKNGETGFNELAAAMGRVGAAEVANTRLNNLSGDLEALQGVWETLSVRIGQVFLPVVRAVVQGLTRVVEFFANATEFGMEVMAKWLVFKTVGMAITGVIITLISQFGGFLVVLLAIKTAFGFVDAAKAAFAVLASGGGIIKALSVLFTNTIRGSLAFRAAFKAIELVFTRFLGFGAIVRIIGGIGPALAAGVGPMAVAGGALRGIGAVMATVGGRILTLLTGINRVAGVFTLLGGPVGLAIRILLGLITVGKILYGTWEPFRNLVDGIVASVTNGFNVAMQAAKDALDGLQAGFTGASSGGEGVAGTFAGIGAAIRPVIDWLVEIWHGIVNNIVPAFHQMVATIQASIGPALNDLGMVISTTLWPALQALGRAFTEELWPAIVQVAQSLWPFIQAIGIVAGVIIGVLFFAVVKIVEFVLGQMIPSLMQLAGPVIAFLIGAISKVIQMFVMFITPIVWVATFIVGTVIPTILRLVSIFADSLVAGITAAVTAVQNIIAWFQAIPAAVEHINTEVNAWFKAMGQGIIDTWNTVITWISDIFNQILTLIIQYINWWIEQFTAFIERFRPIWEPIIQIWQALFDVLVAIVEGFAMLIPKVWQYMFGLISTAIATWVAYVQAEIGFFMRGMQIIFEVAWNFISNIWNDAMQAIQVIFQVASNHINNEWNNFWNGLMQFLQPVIDWFNNTIVAWWDSMFKETDSGTNEVTNVFTQFTAQAQQIFNDVVNAVTNTVNGWMAGFQATVQHGMAVGQQIIAVAWNYVQAIFQGAINILNAVTNGGFSQMVHLVQFFVGQIPGLIQSKWNEAINFFHSIPGTIQNIFNGAGTWLSGVGRTIIDGLLNGLRAAAGSIREFFTNLTNSIPDWKGPYKRDKVLLKPAGQAILHSLGDGFEDEMGRIYKMLNDMNVDIPLAMSATLNPKIDPLSGLLGRPINGTSIVNEAGDQLVSDTYHVDKLIIQNPLPEPASDSLPKTVRRLSAVGARSR